MLHAYAKKTAKIPLRVSTGDLVVCDMLIGMDIINAPPKRDK